MPAQFQVRKIFGKTLDQLSDDVPVPRRVLIKMARVMVDILASESKSYFAKRGWSGRDPMKGPPIWDSFKYRIENRNIIITSSFYGLKELTSGRGIPARKMTWLTQEGKQQKPMQFKRTPGEASPGVSTAQLLSRGWTPREIAERKRKKRGPLIVPIETVHGHIEFRMAPLKLANAWVHPGIARFTFIENAVRKGRVACARILQQELPRILREG